MTIYDFSCSFYFQDDYDKLIMIEYQKKCQQITQKEINEATGIPVSNYRRAQTKGFIGYGKMVEKIAEYLHIQTKIDLEVIEELDRNFSRFYTCVCFSRVEEAKASFELIDRNRDKYENSILMITFYLAQLIYYITDINYSRNINMKKQEEAVDFLQNFVNKMSNEHRFLYYEYMATHSAMKKDPENVVHYCRLTSYLAVNFVSLEPTANYHISFSYSLIGDFINALIYANKALPKLEEELNYDKAILCRINIAALYKKLGNIDEAKRLLRKNLVYMSFNNMNKLKRATVLNYADCLMMENNFKDAISHYKMITEDILKKEDYESILIIYCMYMLNQIDEANEFVTRLVLLEREKQYHIEYLSLILYFRSYFNKEDNLEAMYKNAEEYMPEYKLRGSYIQDVARSMHDGTFNKKQNKYITDPNLAEYIL